MTIKAYDLIVFPCESHQCILVAIGEAGVLRRVFPDGNWEFIEVLGAGSNESSATILDVKENSDAAQP